MPAKIETLKCNAAEILVEPFVPGTVRGSSLLPLPLLLHHVFLFFFFFFDWRSVCFAKSQTPWVVAEPLPASSLRSRTVLPGTAKRGYVEQATSPSHCQVRANPAGSWQKSIELTRPQRQQHSGNTVNPVVGTHDAQGHTHTSGGSMSDSLCFSQIIRTFSSPKYPIPFLSYIPCIIQYSKYCE